MSGLTLGARIIQWARQESAVEGLVQIGSRLRPAGSAAAADENSDWDFQVITSRPQMFDDPAWLGSTDLGPVHHYVARGGRLGSARKVSIITADGELDLVLIPLEQLRGIRGLIETRRYADNPAALRAMSDLALVLFGGFRLLKGESEIASVYDFVATQIPAPRLSDGEAVELAAGFVADYVSLQRKLRRGELLSAQRWLHHQLAETNFRLLHEVRQRQGRVSFPDARRLEVIADSAQAALVTVSAGLSAAALRTAAEASAVSCRALMRELVGEAWNWPELPSGLRAE